VSQLQLRHAKEIGLINDHFQNSSLEEEVSKLAETIASKSNKVVKIGKEAFYKQLEMPLSEAYKYTSEVMSENMMVFRCQRRYCCFFRKKNSQLEK